MESNNNSKSNQELGVDSTELDLMLNKNESNLETTTTTNNNNNKKSCCITTSTGRWLSLKIVLLLLILLIILFIILFIITIYIIKYRQNNIGSKYGELENSTEAWSKCERLAGKLNKCFDRPKCISRPPLFPTTNTSQLVTDVRLPLNIIPSFYILKLQPHIHLTDPNQFFFNGSCTVLAMVKEATNSIKIHSYRLQVNESLIKVLGSAEESLAIKNITYDTDRQWFDITMEEELSKGSDIRVIFGQFRGSLKPTHDLKGWYLSSYKEKNQVKYLATSQLQPTDARMVFPCFDEPAFKAIFKVSIIRRKEYHALANMERVKHEILGDGSWIVDEFKPTLTMSTYLLAFVVSQFDSLSGVDSKGRKFTVWSRPEIIQTANYSLHIGIKILEFFEEYFEIEYPLNKTDMVAVPDFAAGAMENWGLMIYREITMLWDSKVGSADARGKVATVVSHEIAHQWFGNLVTLKWWDDLWLNEGFASFVEYVGVARVHQDWLMDEQFALNELQKVLIPDSLVTSHPVLMPVNHPNEINEIFDTISYNKGASVLRMMEAFLGKATFRKGLKRYLSEYKYKNTIHNDLWRSLTDQATADGKNIPVKEIMDTWIKQMGYPLVTIKNIGNGSVIASQEHFVINSDTADAQITSPYNFTWVIPLTFTNHVYRSWNATEDVTWLKKKSMVVNLPKNTKNWYIFNLHQAGFYRVNYDLENWNNLIMQLRNDYSVIPVKNRAQLIDDLFNIGKVGLVNFSLVLNLTQYLRSEKDFIPWEAANRIFSYLEAILDVDEYYGLLQRYLGYLVDPIYVKVNWDNMVENENHIENLMRPIAVNIACNAGHEQCINEAVERFKKFVKTNDRSRIPSSLRHIIYCIGIRNTGASEWDFLYSKLGNEDQESEVANIIKALSCSREPWILKRFITKLLNNDKVKLPQIVEMMTGLSKNPTGKYVFSDFLWSHYRNISKSGNLLLFVRMYLKRCQRPAECMSIQELDKIRNFATNAGLMMNDKVFAQAIDQVRQNQQFLTLHRDTIGQWLENHQPLKMIQF